MSTPQDASNRKKQKARATKKLAAWRAKQAEKAASTATATSTKKK